MRTSFIKQLELICEKDKDVMLLTGDLGYGNFDNFSKKFPKQFLNVGVAEQNMIMIAAGLALEGKKVFAYSIANFPTLRCLEQIRNDICYHDLNVTIVGMGGGFSYGQLGMTHHATEDLGVMRSIPNMVVTAPATKRETVDILKSLYKLKSPSYLRLDKTLAETKFINKFRFGHANKIMHGNDFTLISIGGILKESLSAANELQKKGIKCDVFSVHSLKPMNINIIVNSIKKTKKLITIEEHSLQGGLASMISEICMVKKLSLDFFQPIGLDNKYSSIVGDQQYLRDYYKLNSKKIIELVINNTKC